MRLEELDVPMIEKALDIYLGLAWGDAAASKRPDYAQTATIGEALDRFTDERRFGKMRKWTLRLGNSRYPFMKLVLQELLVRDRFFFAVDTHDQLDIKEGFDDFDAFLELKRFNADLKDKIEAAWRESGVPTFAGLVAAVECETRFLADQPSGEGRRVLLVDDDVELAQGVDAILTRQGYVVTRTACVEDAERALEKMIPDLILTDLEMPGKSGIEFATAVRADARLKHVPLILATGAGIDATHFALVNAYLIKPFDTAVLLKFVSQAVAKR